MATGPPALKLTTGTSAAVCPPQPQTVKLISARPQAQTKPVNYEVLTVNPKSKSGFER